MRQPFRQASVFVAVLLVIEILIGFLIIIITAIYQQVLGSYLAEMECKMLSNSLINVYIFGVQLIVLFICSLTMWNRIWLRRCTPNIRMIVHIWLFFCLLIICSGFATVWTLFRNSSVLVTSAETSLLRGIDFYYSYPEWKLLWDGLQLHKQCCGVNSYLDWNNADWLPKQDEMGSLGADVVLAPHTCCKRSCTNCFQRFMPKANNRADNGGSVSNATTAGNGNDSKGAGTPFPKLSIESINKEGCLPVFSDAMWNFLYILLVLVALSLKFLICLCCLTKYIMSKQSYEDLGFIDDEGRPLVVVKYPCTVRCITLGEDDLASDIAPDGCNCPNCDEPNDQCCCNDFFEGS